MTKSLSTLERALDRLEAEQPLDDEPQTLAQAAKLNTKPGSDELKDTV